MKICAVIVAAGSSTRMGGAGSKLFLPLCGRPVLFHTLSRFAAAQCIERITVVTRACDFEAVHAAAEGIEKPVDIIEGGATRQDSVLAGVSHCADADFVAVHDGARPFVSPDEIARVCAAALESGAASLAVPVKDTITVVRDDFFCETPDRASLCAVQTPQVFRRSAYLEAAQGASCSYTDDCQLLQTVGVRTVRVLGSYKNIKITTPEDMLIAEAFCAAEQKEAE